MLSGLYLEAGHRGKFVRAMTSEAAALLDVAPTTSFAQSSAIHSLAASRGMRFVFMGGEDGFVRKYDFEATLNGVNLLPSTQKHMLPDSVTKGGVLSAMWENEQLKFQPDYKLLADGSYNPQLSPVYSLACQSEALWVAAGLESGDISIQSATYGDLGQPLVYLRGHTKPVSELKLASSERFLLSGSWDKSVVCWDMETGKAVNKYRNLSSQVSAVDWQPLGGAAVEPMREEEMEEDDDKSLFGSDSDDEKKEKHEKHEVEKRESEERAAEEKEEENKAEKTEATEEKKAGAGDGDEVKNKDETNTGATDPNVFLTCAFNGKIDIWDRRQQERASTLLGSKAPPWCVSCAFSIDGNSIFAGRRNSSVEWYDVRSVNQPLRTLKFPAISGSVNCVLPMPDKERLLCASHDNIRLYDLNSQRKIPFTIVPGHHGTTVSRMIVDSAGKYIVSTTGGRGWIDVPYEAALAYEAGYV